MSDGAMLIEAARRLFADRIDDAAMRRARAGEWLGDAWDAMVEMGLPLALVPEQAGGFGVAIADALDLVRLTGASASPLPLAETMIANGALGSAGLPLADGPAALVEADEWAIDGERVIGSAVRVPWGRDVGTLVVVRGDRLFRIDTGFDVSERSTNLAHMPRDTLRIDAPFTTGQATGIPPRLAGAALRSLQIAGALQTMLDLTVSHVSDRVQFGRPLAKFQAVQHELARLGGEVAAAGAAADMASEALAGDPARAVVPIAAATIRAREAASVAVGIAQQLHGAIGFTAEHRLHWFTTALWSWRDEYGGQREWSDLLGRAVLDGGGAGFWPFVTEAA